MWHDLCAMEAVKSQICKRAQYLRTEPAKTAKSALFADDMRAQHSKWPNGLGLLNQPNLIPTPQKRFVFMGVSDHIRLSCPLSI
jgi:hypothetical protein